MVLLILYRWSRWCNKLNTACVCFAAHSARSDLTRAYESIRISSSTRKRILHKQLKYLNFICLFFSLDCSHSQWLLSSPLWLRFSLCNTIQKLKSTQLSWVKNYIFYALSIHCKLHYFSHQLGTLYDLIAQSSSNHVVAYKYMKSKLLTNDNTYNPGYYLPRSKTLGSTNAAILGNVS